MRSKSAIILSVMAFLEMHSKTSINFFFKTAPGIGLKYSSDWFFRHFQSHEVDNWDGNHFWCSTELCPFVPKWVMQKRGTSASSSIWIYDGRWQYQVQNTYYSIIHTASHALTISLYFFICHNVKWKIAYQT